MRARAPTSPETRPASVTASVSPGTGGARSGGSSSASTPGRRGPRRCEGWLGRPAFKITKTSEAVMHAGGCQRVADGDQRETPVSWRLSHSVIDSVGLAAASSRITCRLCAAVRGGFVER